jgi:hypothetical protein
MAQQKVWEFKEVSLKFASTGGTSDVQMRTDLPTSWATRLTGKTLGNTSGVIQTDTIPLDGITGSVFDFTITPASAATLQLREGVVLARPIGVYLNGAKGEIWTMQPRAPGV